LQNRRLAIIAAIVFVDLLGFSLILPLLPYYADAFGASQIAVSLLSAAFAGAQFLGAPIIGRLSDRHGRRPLLLVSILGTMAGFLLLGFAEPLGRAIGSALPASWVGENVVRAQNLAILAILYVSRFIDGLTGGNITVAQAYITDVTEEKDRARGLGLIGAAFGLGFIVGPAIGGTLSRWGYAVPAFVAAGLTVLNLASVLFWLPESLTPEQRAAFAHSPRTAFSLRLLWDALHRPRFGPLLTVRIFYGLAFNIFQIIFAQFAQVRLELTVQTTSYVLAYVGVLAALVQGVAIRRLTTRFSETTLILSGVALLTLSLLAWAFVPNLVLLLIVLAPLSAAAGVLNTVISSAITKAVVKEEAGGALGLSAATESLTRVIAPSLGGVLLQWVGTWAPGVFGALVMAGVTAFAWLRLPAREKETA
jgi:DHA1 family tetracycline resistance protein-like MFS transporter